MAKLLTIDSGISGAIALFEDKKLLHTSTMPTIKIETIKKLEQFDLKDGKKQFIKSGPNKGKPKMKLRRAAKHKYELDCKILMGLMFAADKIIIEQQGCQPLNSTKVCSTIMFNYGKLLAIAELSEKDYETVLPAKWKTEMHVSMTKDEKKALKNDSKLIKHTLKAKAVSLAKKLSGLDFVTPQGRMQHDEAEATLIGYWYISKDK